MVVYDGMPARAATVPIPSILQWQKPKTKISSPKFGLRIFLDPVLVARSSSVLSWDLDQTWVWDFCLRLFTYSGTWPHPPNSLMSMTYTVACFQNFAAIFLYHRIIRATRASFAAVFFLQRKISAVSQPIAMKLCHMIGNGCNFNKKAELSLTNPRDACEKFARFT